MSFIVQISPFVHLFTLKIVFRWGSFAPEPPTRDLPWICWGALGGPQTPRRKLCLHFILYLATPLTSTHISITFLKKYGGKDLKYP